MHYFDLLIIQLHLLYWQQHLRQLRMERAANLIPKRGELCRLRLRGRVARSGKRRFRQRLGGHHRSFIQIGGGIGHEPVAVPDVLKNFDFVAWMHLDAIIPFIGPWNVNEEAIGAAIAAARLPRKDLHVTTKVWHENLAPDAIRRAFDGAQIVIW